MHPIMRTFASLLLLGVTASVPSQAFTEEPSNPYGPVRLSRLSLIEGEVLLQRGDEEEWVAAAINMPLRLHDKLWSTDGARAEIQFDDGSVVRLAENTNLDLLSLEPGWTHLQLTLGVASFVAHTSSRGGTQEAFLEIDTPQATLQVTRSTTFRVDVAEDGSTEITVREGEVELGRDEEPIVVVKNQRVVIEGGDSPRYLLESAQELDEWDRWNENRDTQLAQARSIEHLSHDIAMGATELDEYGRWDQMPPYGWVWIPRVTTGWVPYQVGRWVWIEPWGWTWVSYEPWGWIPYHYGRWVVVTAVGWVWVPSPILEVWAPGYVRFIYGPDWVAWVPLAPGEVSYYNPGISVHVDINLINYRVPGAVTVVPRRVFVTGVSERRRFVPPKDPIRAGRVATGPPPVVPTRASLRPVPQKLVRADLLPPRVIHRPVVYTRPPSDPPLLFEHRVKKIREVITQGRPPVVATPRLQERGLPKTEERRVSDKEIHKDITTHKVIKLAPSPTIQKPTPRPPENQSRPGREVKTGQPHPPKRVELSKQLPQPSAPKLSEGQTREAQMLYRVPPKPKAKRGKAGPNKGGKSEGTSENR